MRSLLQDLRYESRFLIKNPGFAAAVILTLALSIGANTAVFNFTNALLIRALPYSDPQKLVLINVQRNADTVSASASLNRYEMIRDHNRSFTGVAAAANDSMNLTGSGEPQQVAIARVTPNFFSVLGVVPYLGRAFSDDEGRPEGQRVVMISNNLWRNRFGSNQEIVGRTINLDSIPYTIIGVLSANVQFPFLAPADVWTPRYFEHTLMPTARLRLGVGYLSLIARVRDGVSLASAQSEANVLNEQYAQANPKAPDAGPSHTLKIDNLRDATVANIKRLLLLLTGAVAAVLLIGCANVASLLLSRALSRRKEIAIRTAIGAQRAIIVRQLLAQCLLLASISGILGFALAFGAVHTLPKLQIDQLPAGAPISMDWRVLLFTIGVSLFAGVIFGLAPALQLSRVNVSTMLRDEDRGTTGGRGHARLKSALVIGQVALSLVLLIGAALLLRSFTRLLQTDPGFDERNLLTMNISLPTVKYANPEQQIAFFNELLRKTSVLPGVRSAAISTALPLNPKRITPVLPEGQPEVPLTERPFIIIEAISPAWFQTMHLPLQGRAFTDADIKNSPNVVIVNQALAKRYWPNENPIGKHITIGRLTPSEIVGVAGDVKNDGVASDPKVQLYMPFAQIPWADVNLLLRTSVEPHSIVSAVRQQVFSVDAEQPITAIQTGDELMEQARAQSRFTMLLTASFSVIAIVLALIGIYSVLAYTVAQRRQELGIRLALGAERSSIVATVVRQGLMLVGCGVGVGLIVSAVATRAMASVLYHVSTLDLATYCLAPLGFLLMGLLASYIPARRAAEVNPLEIMR
ncbi:MAG TPA: ABC transporter permease [Candidatus Sulfotelmatobacter sp.]|nr:ABC transporter permease [Candidatus Sulfotelmatobacter sp.]